MYFLSSWNLPATDTNVRKIPRKEPLTKTMTAYISTIKSNFYSPIINNIQIKQTTKNITTYIQTTTFHTYLSMINTTQKSNNITIRNKIFISLFISFILISLCIGLSYGIFIYFTHYLNTKSAIKTDILILNRVSYTSSEDSNYDTQLHTCKMKNNILPKTMNNKNKERRLSIDSIKLFRY